ncbi:hypothetical protein ABIB90_007954, partial [Bradyrhizobium sp. JR4.1]
MPQLIVLRKAYAAARITGAQSTGPAMRPILRIRSKASFDTSKGGFKRSSQHQEFGGCDERCKAQIGAVRTSPI